MNAQAITFAQKIMALAIHHFALALAGLLGKFGLLPLDPTQLVDHRQPHGLIADDQRHGHTHPPHGRVHAQVQVFDVFAHHLDLDATHLKTAGLFGHLRAHLSSHFDASPIPKSGLSPAPNQAELLSCYPRCERSGPSRLACRCSTQNVWHGAHAWS